MYRASWSKNGIPLIEIYCRYQSAHRIFHSTITSLNYGILSIGVQTIIFVHILKTFFCLVLLFWGSFQLMVHLDRESQTMFQLLYFLIFQNLLLESLDGTPRKLLDVTKAKLSLSQEVMYNTYYLSRVFFLKIHFKNYKIPLLL